MLFANTKYSHLNYQHMGEGLYINLWEAQLPTIKEAIIAKGGRFQLRQSKFESVGNRQNYRFRLDMKEPKISGSAVARDLKQVLDSDSEICELEKNAHIVIRMGKEFRVEVIVG